MDDTHADAAFERTDGRPGGMGRAATAAGVRFVDLDATTVRCYTIADTAVGELLLVGDERALSGLYFHLYDRALAGIGADWRQDRALLAGPLEQVRAYLAGDLTVFDLDVATGGGAFQQQVWRALAEIPYGRTTSYGRIAASIGRPSASRAVGMANGRNPISLVLPCHRVVGASGALTGYGGGLDRKRWLLGLERATLARTGG